MTNPIVLGPGGNITVKVVAYDQYGNLIGSNGSVNDSAIWHTTGSLWPLPPGSTQGSTQFYNPSDTNADTGYLVVTYDSSGVTARDSVLVINQGRPNKLVSAFTGDWDGDGLLDHITITFQKPLLLNSVAGIDNDITVYDKQQGFNLTVDSVYPASASGGPQTQWVLALQEKVAVTGGTPCRRRFRQATGRV